MDGGGNILDQMVELPPGFDAERRSLVRSREALRGAERCIRVLIEQEDSLPAGLIVRQVAEAQQVPASMVKLALLTLLQQGEVSLGAGYRLRLANR